MNSAPGTGISSPERAISRLWGDRICFFCVCHSPILQLSRAAYCRERGREGQRASKAGSCGEDGPKVPSSLSRGVRETQEHHMIRAQAAGWAPGAQKHTSRGNVICPPPCRRGPAQGDRSLDGLTLSCGFRFTLPRTNCPPWSRLRRTSRDLYVSRFVSLLVELLRAVIRYLGPSTGSHLRSILPFSTVVFPLIPFVQTTVIPSHLNPQGLGGPSTAT